jgi:hypothetical protein
MRYSTGIADSGRDPTVRDSSTADRAEKPASSSVSVLIATSPRSTRLAQSSAPGLEPSRTSADLSISHDVLMTMRRT